jgi:hypothetical protein
MPYFTSWSANFWEDSGNIGDVNQGLEGMQKKYGELRVADVESRSNNYRTRNGMALRGFNLPKFNTWLFIVRHSNHQRWSGNLNTELAAEKKSTINNTNKRT